MGRKPNKIITDYFTRGEKNKDKGNRYSQTCNRCEETFPKGRSDSLKHHIMKKCPAIPEHERREVCLILNGLSNPSSPPPPQHVQLSDGQPNQQSVNVPIMQPSWRSGLDGLDALAEASRQVDLGEKHEPHAGVTNGAAVAGVDGTLALPIDHLEVRQAFTIDNPPAGYENRAPKEKGGMLIISHSRLRVSVTGVCVHPLFTFFFYCLANLSVYISLLEHSSLYNPYSIFFILNYVFTFKFSYHLKGAKSWGIFLYE
jgi:hypothetical protein